MAFAAAAALLAGVELAEAEDFGCFGVVTLALFPPVAFFVSSAFVGGGGSFCFSINLTALIGL